MNAISFTVAGIGILTLCGTLTSGFGEISTLPGPLDSAKDRAKWRLTTLSAAREILDELNHPAPFSPEDRAILIEKLNTVMREDVQRHASRTASQRLCAEIAISMRRESLARRFQAVIAHANEQSVIPIRWTDVVSHLGVDWSNTVEKTMQSFATHEQSPLFNDARARALGLLRQEREQQLRYPTEIELNAILDPLLCEHPDTPLLTEKDEGQLQQKIMALSNPDRKPFFEELKQVLNEQTRRISGEIRKQYERQLTCLETIVARDVPADRRQAAAIGTALLSNLEADLASERAKTAAPDVSGKTIPLYPLLSSVRNSVPERARKLEIARLTAFLNDSPSLAVQSNTLVHTIRAEPEKHHTLTNSEAIFMKSLTPPLQEETARAYALGANPPGAAAYFRILLSSNVILAGAFESRMTRELHTSLVKARETVCEEQYAKAFATLGRRDILSPEALQALQDSGGVALTTLPEALNLFGISIRDSHTLLEETVSRVLTLANRKALEGYGVLTSQMALVRKLEQDRLDKLRQDVAARRPYKEIRAEWQASLETAWAADSRARTTPYKDVLDLTLASLNKSVRQLYDSIHESPNAATAATPAEAHPNPDSEQGKIKELRQDPAKPEEQNQEPPKDIQPPAPKTSPKAGGSEGVTDKVTSRTRVDRRNEPNGILLLTGAADGPSTARLLNAAGLATCSVTFNPGKPQDAAATIFEAMKPNLNTLWSKTVLEWQKEHSGLGFLKRRTPPKLKLFIVIESEDVRHRMSLLLRQQIEGALAEWNKSGEKGTPEVELDWKVGLTLEQTTQTP